MPKLYEGHLPNASPIQRHSAGEWFPFVKVQKGTKRPLHGLLYGGKVQWFNYEDMRETQIELFMDMKAKYGEATMLKAFKESPFTADYNEIQN